MSITVEQWLQIVEEFAEEAYQRIVEISNPNNNVIIDNGEVEGFVLWNNLSLKPISELIAHDIEWYGLDNTLLMYEYQYFDKWVTCTHSEYLTPRCRRKPSAALPFDIDRAENGDAVEVLPVLEVNWQTLDKCFDKIELHDGFIVVRNTKEREFGQFNLDRIRMKFPQRTHKHEDQL